MRGIERVKRTLSVIAMVIAVMGTITFSLFIVEEAFQTAMFGSWAAKDANDWPLALEGADLMVEINHMLRVMVYSIGWVQPLAFLSYRAYANSADYYIESLHSEIFAHEPSLFIGRTITVSIKPQRIEHLSDGNLKLHAQRFYVLSSPSQSFVSGQMYRMSGSVHLDGSQVCLRSRP